MAEPRKRRPQEYHRLVESNSPPLKGKLARGNRGMPNLNEIGLGNILPPPAAITAPPNMVIWPQDASGKRPKSQGRTSMGPGTPTFAEMNAKIEKARKKARSGGAGGGF